MKLRLGSRVAPSIFSLDDIGRLVLSRVTSVGRLYSARRIGVPTNKAFGWIQHRVIVGKPRIEVSNAFGNLSETGLMIKIRGTGKENNIISKLRI